MRTQQSVSLLNKIFISICIIFIFLLSGCKTAEVFGLPPDKVLERLKKGDYGFLRSIPFSEKDLDDLDLLGENSAYYLSLIFEEIGRNRAAERLMQEAADTGTGICREKASAVLRRRAIKENYHQDKYPAVLDGIAGLPEGERDPEMLLMEVVSGYSIGEAQWTSGLQNLLKDVPAGNIHIRLYIYACNQQRFRKEAGEDILRILLWKNLAARGLYAKAAESGGELLSNMKPGSIVRDILTSETNCNDFTAVFARNGENLAGAELLADLFSPNLHVLHTAGKLYRYAGHSQKAAEIFLKAMETAQGTEYYDRELWYMLTSVFRFSPEKALQLLYDFGSTWKDPGYFDDFLEECSSYLVRNREWKEILSLQSFLEEFGSLAVRERFTYLSLRIRQLGFVPGNEKQNPELDFPPGNAERRPEELYYRALYSYFLEEKPFLIPESSSQSIAEPSLLKPEDAYILGFLSFGLTEEGYEAVQSIVNRVSEHVLKALAEALNEAGMYRKSLNTGNILAERGLTLGHVLFPRPFFKTIEKTAGKEGLPLPLFIGLIREESYFDPAAVSSSGAAGLTQLMPATAGDMAGRMGLESYDLTLPGDNIALGGRYLGEMLRRFISPVRALCAYNAGPGRVRTWERIFSSLPPDLFLEAVPFRETREYGRKVLVAALYYGYLYEKMAPELTLEQFFIEP